MTEAKVNGPRPGNRNRNTVVNNYSKQGYQAPVGLSSVGGYGSQMAGAQYGYLAQLAMLRAQQAPLRGQFQMAKVQARGQRVADVTAYEQDATERGVLGSSADLSSRAGAIGAQAASIAAARSDYATGRLGLQSQGIDARNQYYQQVSGIQQAMSAERAQNSISAFQRDMFDAITQLRNQKRGNTPRQRAGTRDTATPPPKPHYGSGQGIAAEYPGATYHTGGAWIPQSPRR